MAGSSGGGRSAPGGWLLLVLAAAGLALALGLTRFGNASAVAPRAVPVAATGRVHFVNSHSGMAILRASNLAPGQSARGTVTIRNSGAAPGSLRLRRTAVVETPGPNGGSISEALRLLVEDVTGGSRAVVYSGTLAAMGRPGLGTVAVGEARRYRLSAIFPDGGAPPTETDGDNRYAAAGATFTFRWTMVVARAGRCSTRLSGTAAPERLIGTQSGDRILAGGGGDLVDARRGPDCAAGEGGADRLLGRAGNDALGGGRGPDRIFGGYGDDLLRGNGGGDRIGAGHGSDRIFGGLDNDRIRARNGRPGVVDCGPGRRDTAIADRTDTVRDCERISYRSPHAIGSGSVLAAPPGG